MVSFEVNKQPIKMQPGELWALWVPWFQSGWLQAPQNSSDGIYIAKTISAIGRARSFFVGFCFPLVKARVTENTACGKSLNLLISSESWDFYCP